MNIEKYTVKSNGHFGILEKPKPHKQHPNQQNGLDLYIRLINFSTGEECFKKLYENKKGFHFKHGSPHYLSSFTETATYIPFQIIKGEEESNKCENCDDGIVYCPKCGGLGTK